jgi:hypothetical protein
VLILGTGRHGLDSDPGAEGNPQALGRERVAHLTEGRYSPSD